MLPTTPQRSAVPVLDWKNQAIEMLNEPNWRVVDPGPLHHPVLKFTIRRDERFALFIETEAVKGATCTASEVPSGTVRINTDKVELAHMFGSKSTLSGLNTVRLHPDADPVRERSRIHELTLTLPNAGPAAYTIEWLENLPSHYIWPDQVTRATETKTGISFGDGDFTISHSHDGGGSGGAAILTIAGYKLYICAPCPVEEAATPRSGFIAYDGLPDDNTRKKIRTALSFAFGVYLVEIGHTIFDKDWLVVAATARTAYSLGNRASELPMQPLVWLTDRNFQFDISRTKLTRMVERFFSMYDELDLGNLSWAYWHACIVPPHIAPAHFGSAIEALQRSYGKANHRKIRTRILADGQWDQLLRDITAVIQTAPISEEDKAAVAEKIRSNANSAPKRDQLNSLAQMINIEIGADEEAAWRRRDKSAHGIPIPEGKELEAIRDMKLLMVLFHRMLLAITGAADCYNDYASPGIPMRPLKDLVPSVASG
jgi:hypothetical protein